MLRSLHLAIFHLLQFSPALQADVPSDKGRMMGKNGSLRMIKKNMVVNTLFILNESKSPGPDGLHSLGY